MATFARWTVGAQKRLDEARFAAAGALQVPESDMMDLLTGAKDDIQEEVTRELHASAAIAAALAWKYTYSHVGDVDDALGFAQHLYNMTDTQIRAEVREQGGDQDLQTSLERIGDL